MRKLGLNPPEEMYVPDYLGPDDADYSKAIAYVEGAFCPLSEAKVSVRDFGLTHADYTYDVFHSWKGGIFCLEEHMDRFEHSLAGLHLDPGLTRQQMTDLLMEGIARSGLRDTIVYYACLRGVPPNGSRDPLKAKNHFLFYVQPLVLRGQPAEMRRGLSVMVSPDVRRIPSDSVDPHLKNSHWGDFTRALFPARAAGFDTTVLLNHEGFLAEGPGFNVVLVEGGKVATPDRNVLQGVSCRVIMEIAGDLGLETAYEQIAPERLMEADEIFITSTSCGLFPVTRIDGRIVGNGAPGPLSVRLLNEYYRRKDAGWHITPVDYDRFSTQEQHGREGRD